MRITASGVPIVAFIANWLSRQPSAPVSFRVPSMSGSFRFSAPVIGSTTVLYSYWVIGASPARLSVVARRPDYTALRRVSAIRDPMSSAAGCSASATTSCPSSAVRSQFGGGPVRSGAAGQAYRCRRQTRQSQSMLPIMPSQPSVWMMPAISVSRSSKPQREKISVQSCSPPPTSGRICARASAM